MRTLEVNTEYTTLPQRKPNAANPAFNVRPNGAKAPSPGQASAVSGTPGFARTRPIRPNGAKAATGAFKSSARKHSSCCPAPRAPPHTYNKSRAHARVYTQNKPLKKCFNPSALIPNPLIISAKQAEGFDFQTFQHRSAMNASPQPQGLEKIVPRLKNQSAGLKNRKAGPKEGHPGRGGDKRGTRGRQKGDKPLSGTLKG